MKDMFNDVKELYNEAKEFIREFDFFVQKYCLKDLVVVDHICYKCSFSGVFEEIRKIFEGNSRWIYQTIISNRRIATIRINGGLKTSVGDIEFIELCDQKPDESQVDGFDHIEICPVLISYEQLVSTLKSQGLSVKEIIRPHHTTHDVKLENGFVIKLTKKLLEDKIKQEQI